MFFRLVRSVGQRKNSKSSWALRIFFPDIFLYFFTKLKTCHLSYSTYKDNLVSPASRTLLWAKKCCLLSRSTFFILLFTYPKAVCSFINLHFKVCHVGQSSITTTLVFACLVSWSSNRSVSSSALC